MKALIPLAAPESLLSKAVFEDGSKIGAAGLAQFKSALKEWATYQHSKDTHWFMIELDSDTGVIRIVSTKEVKRRGT